MRQNTFYRRNSNRRKRDKIKRNKADPALVLRPAFKGQPTWSQKIIADYHKLATTVTTGLISTNITISVADITNFAARFIAFEEYRIVKAVLRMNLFSSTNPGRIVAYIDDDDSTAPNLANAHAHRNITFAASDVGGEKTLTYVPHSPDNQNWQTVATGTTAIGFFKIYTNNANLGASIVATDYIGYMMDLTIQFRGLTG